MNSHLRSLKQLIDDGMYGVDEHEVANAILARATVHATVAHASFRSEEEVSPVLSFRREQPARSFRIHRSSRLHRLASSANLNEIGTGS